MRNIFIVKNKSHIFKHIDFDASKYLSVDLDDLSVTEINGQETREIDDFRKNIDKEVIEKKYIDFIASLGLKNRSIYWWAGNLAEKDSFTSKLFNRIYKLVYLDKILQQIKDKDCLLICSDRILIAQINFNYKKRFKINNFSFKKYNFIQSFIKTAKGFFQQAYYALYEYIKLLYSRYTLSFKKADIVKNNNYVVFRTWVDSRNYKTGRYIDSYFKKLPEFFVENKRNILIFAGVSSNYKENINKFKNDNDVSIITINLYLKGIDILRCLLYTYFRRPSVKKNIFIDNYEISYLIREELSKDILDISFFYALMQYYCCLRLAKNVSIGKFIYTFENYSWEKMSILGLRKSKSSVKIVGFQHAFISRNDFKYFPGKKEQKVMPLPDRIITMGNKTKEIMEKFGDYPKNIFSIGCALRQDYLSRMSISPRKRKGDIFVPLTITVEDTIKVLRFLFKSGLGNCSEKVYLRPHPATPIESCIKKLEFPLPNNFIISREVSILSEIERCSIALHTWTTVCLEVLKMGRPVVYLDVNYPLELDPLFECNNLKDICSRPEDLIGKIEKTRNIDNEEFDLGIKKTQDYLKEYFYPVERENLLVFLNN